MITRRGCAGSAFDQPGTQAAYEADLEAVEFAIARRDRLDAAITAMAADSEFTAVVRKLCCLRGVSTLTGFALAVEIGDWQRFTGAGIGAYLGLVPSEYSSGQSRRQGGITKAGNSHVRRLLVEAAWHHQPRYTVGKVLQARWDQAPEAARCPRSHRQSEAAPTLGLLHRPQEDAHHRHDRDRPRARRLVLVPGNPARLTSRPPIRPRRPLDAHGTCGTDPRNDCEPRAPLVTLDLRSRGSVPSRKPVLR